MPANDTTAVNAHNTAVTAMSAALYRPLRKVGGGAVDPTLQAAATAIAAAVAATNAATVNPAQAAPLAIQRQKFSRMVPWVTSPLGVKRRQALRQLRTASRTLVALHTVNV